MFIRTYIEKQTVRQTDRQTPMKRLKHIDGWLLVGWYYLPTPPLGQDMTHGQFLSGV